MGFVGFLARITTTFAIIAKREKLFDVFEINLFGFSCYDFYGH